MIEVGTGVSLGIQFAGSDFSGIRTTVDIDELVDIGGFLHRDVRGVVIHRIGLIPQRGRHHRGLIEGTRRIVERTQRAIVDLRKVAHLMVRIDVKSDRSRTQSKRI